MRLPIIIMVLSHTEPPYDELMRAQQETWDAVEEPMVKTMYYTGGNRDPKFIHPWSVHYSYNCSDAYYEMQWKFKLMLDTWLASPFTAMGYRVFRTNSSSYINKRKLAEWAETMPTEKCYAGWKGSDFISGAGMLLSPDVCKLLADAIEPGEQIEEDVLIGRILGAHDVGMIDDKTRFDVTEFRNPPLDRYHYRFKTSDRLQDAENMKKLHDLIITNNG